MKLDFEAIKKIPIPQVLSRFGIRLRYRGEYGMVQCPLPTHKEKDKARTFSVNVRENYWRCFSDSCNAKNQGRKGGDVINLVALLENCSEYQAAEKLATWYGLNGNAPREAERPEFTTRPSHPSTPAGEVKPRYMEAIDAWFDELVKRGEKETDEVFWKRVRNGVKSKLLENWRNGVKAGKEGTAPT
jgi:hypothetical protein